MSSSVFRAYDIRGLVGEDFDAAWVERLGRACAQCLRDQGVADVIIGFDCRASSPEYHDALSRGFMLGGVDVVSVGMVPTPALYFAVRHLNRRAGVMITASHNPAPYNGFKIWMGESTIYGQALQELRVRMERGDFASGQGLFSQFDIRPAYLEAISARISLARPLKVVVDGGNGAGGELCCEALSRLGAEVVPLYCQPDGAFPNHHPDPVVEENMSDLIRMVREHQADFGVGLDGDGDRLGVVDRNGRLLNGDELLSIFASDVLQRRPGAVIIGDVKCSGRLFDAVRAAGGRPLMSATGHSLIKARMREADAAVAGEISGHMFFADGWYGFDDAVYSAARLAGIVSRSPVPLEKLPDWPLAFATREINVPCPEEHKETVIAQARAYFGERWPVEELDGVRIRFPDGWGLVRASNTQPILVTRFEAASESGLEAMREDTLRLVQTWIENARSPAHAER